MKKASASDYFVVNAYWLGLSMMWNSLHVIILPAVLLNYVPGIDDLCRVDHFYDRAAYLRFD